MELCFELKTLTECESFLRANTFQFKDSAIECANTNKIIPKNANEDHYNLTDYLMDPLFHLLSNFVCNAYYREV